MASPLHQNSNQKWWPFIPRKKWSALAMKHVLSNVDFWKRHFVLNRQVFCFGPKMLWSSYRAIRKPHFRIPLQSEFSSSILAEKPGKLNFRRRISTAFGWSAASWNSSAFDLWKQVQSKSGDGSLDAFGARGSAKATLFFSKLCVWHGKLEMSHVPKRNI